jgi:hypothetical protein
MVMEKYKLLQMPNENFERDGDGYTTKSNTPNFVQNDDIIEDSQ